MSPQIIPLKGRQISGIQPNSGDRDYSRLSCAAGEMPLGPRAAGIFSKRYAPTLAAERHRCEARIGRDFSRSRDDPALSRLEIDDQLEFHGLLDWQVAADIMSCSLGWNGYPLTWGNSW
jgi:hypothetical protein